MAPADRSAPPKPDAAGATALPLVVPRLGPGIQLHSLRGPAAVLDPFIAIDHFRMGRAVFAPHPHAGFSAVTYLFDDSTTGLLNRDSQGREGPIHPGDLHWTLAGSGLMHEERPLQEGCTAHGLQIFVNLPQAERLQPPQALSLAAARMPALQGEGWRGRLVFGQAFGRSAPLELPVPASLAVLQLDDGATVDADLAAASIEATRVVFVVDGPGALIVEARDGRSAARSHQTAPAAIALAPGQRLRAHGAVRVAFFTGRPLREPLVQHGPFVMGSEGQIVDAMRRYQAGAMGRPPPYQPPPEPPAEPSAKPPAGRRAAAAFPAPATGAPR